MGPITSFMIYGPLSTAVHRLMPRQKPQGVLLTFDDGPDPRYTPLVLALLQRYHIKAIFFVLSRKARRYPELTQEIIRQGHQVALHGAYHLDAWKATPKQVEQNMRLGIKQLQRLGISPTLYRPPFGRVNLFHRSSLLVVYWTTLFFDWNIRSKERMLASLKEHSKSGEILLLHDGSEGRAVEGMPYEMLEVLEKWLAWAVSSGIHFSDGGSWPHE